MPGLISCETSLSNVKIGGCREIDSPFVILLFRKVGEKFMLKYSAIRYSADRADNGTHIKP